MEKDIIVIDDLLPIEQFNEIRNTMLSNNFPWFYNDGVNFSTENDLDLFQFTHLFYDNYQPKSSYTNILSCVVDKLEAIALVRIKANLLTRTSNNIIHGMHIDILASENNLNTCAFKGKTAVYYVNTNNGYTLFDDGNKVESLSNRLVIFDSDIKHSGTSCTDQKIRCVINFNYIERIK